MLIEVEANVGAKYLCLKILQIIKSKQRQRIIDLKYRSQERERKERRRARNVQTKLATINQSINQSINHD